MNWRFVHRVWALVWHPRKTTLGVQTLCIALLLIAGTTSPARADCPAAPIANPNDMAISFLVANSVQASSASLLASSVKEGTLVYDDTANELKVCNGTSWVAVGTGTGSIAAGAASEVQFRDSGTGAFAADSAFRYDPAAHILTISPNPATLSQAPFTNTVLHLSNVDGSAPRLLMEAFSNGSTTAPNFSMRSANGTGAAPLALRNEDILGQLTFTGHNGTSFATARSAIRGTATEDWTPTANGADLRFHTTPNGTADVIEAMRIANNGNVGIGTATAPIVSAVAGRTSLSIKGASDGGVLELANGSADTDPATVGVIQFSNPNFTPTSDVKTRVAAIAVRSTGATVGDRGGVIEFHTKKDGDILALRMLIDGNGNAGIGTTTPQSMLHVAGGIQLGDDAATCPGASDVKLGTLRFNGSDLQVCKSGGWSAIGSGGGATPAGNDGSIQFKSGSSLAADASNLHWDDANNRLGIGTATPEFDLDVVAASPAPNAVIAVKGDGTSSYLSTRSYGGTPHFQSIRYGGSLSSPTIVSANDPIMVLAAHGYDGTAVRQNAGIVMSVDGTPGPSDMPGRITFATTADGTASPVERMRISSSGNVGIGTTTPQSVLQVAGGIQLGDDTTTCPGASNVKLGTLRFNGGDLQVCKAGGWSAIGSGGGATPAGNDGSIQFKSGSNLAADAANLHWDDTNNRLGIGTASPANKLDVQGAGTISGRVYSSDSDARQIVEAAGTGGRGWFLQTGNNASGLNGRFRIWDNTASAERFAIASNGNVGMGTNNPTQKLHISGSGAVGTQIQGTTYGYLNLLTSNNSAVVGLGDAGSLYLTTYESLPITFHTNSAERLRISETGNVGIGTASPSGRLHTVGEGVGGNFLFMDGYGWAPSIVSRRANGTIATPTAVLSGEELLGIGGRGNNGSAFTGSAQALVLMNAEENWTTTANGANMTFATTASGGTTRTEKMRITGAGNVGIGTTDPQSKLQVAGGIQLGDDAATCPGTGSVKLGTLKYLSNTLSVCNSGGWTALAAGTGITALTGDVTASGSGSVVATIANNAVTSAKILDGTITTADLANSGVTNAKLANMAANTIKGNNTGSAAAPVDLTMAQLATMLDGTGTFVKKAGDSMTGQLVNTGGLAASQAMATATGGLGAFEARSEGSAGTAGAAFMTFHRPGAYAAYFGLDTDNQLKIGGWSMGANAYKIWHENNDGAASGLDADLLDGQDSAFYRNASNLNAGTVATARLGSGTANSTTYLRGDGTWQSVSGGPIQSTAQTASGTAVDFTGIPATAKRVTITFASLSTNSSSPILIQLGTSGGHVTTGYSGSASATAGGNIASDRSTAGFLTSAGGSPNTASSMRHGNIVCSNLSGNTWVCGGDIGYSDADISAWLSGSITLGGILDRLRLTTVSGTATFDSGSVNITYE